MEFLKKVEAQIIDPIIMVLAIGAFVYFLWGLAMFVWRAGDAEAQTTGRNAMLWGTIGLVIIFGTKAIIALIQATVASIG